MPFDSSVITQVYPPVFRGGQMLLRWDSSAPAGQWYQVYLGGELAWWGQSLTASIDAPSGFARVDIGAVGATEYQTDFSASLSPVRNRVRLTWLAGPGQAPDLAGFRVYGEHSPGGGIDYATALADLPAVEQGIRADGFGFGGFGGPVFGSIYGSYTWESGTYTRGTWNFAVKEYDSAGNEGAAYAAAVAVVTPPRPPAPNAAGKRLTYTYDSSSKRVTLNWLASPG